MAKLNIYRNGSIIASPEIDEGTVLVKKLMNEDKITAAFNSATVLPLELGDYVVFDGANYKLNQPPGIEIINRNTNKYTCVFQSVLYDLYDKMLISSDGLADFAYTGTAADMLTLIIDNINQIYMGWAVGDVDASDTKSIDFSNTNCRSALTLIADTFGFEFQLEGKTIHFKEAVGTIRDLIFKYGQNQGLYNLTRKPVDSKTLVTRLYAFGGTKNLPYTYRDHAKRLVFEERYLEKNTAVYGIKENYYTNEDIFPNRTATLTAVSDPFDGGDASYVVDSTIDFNINDYLAEGLVAKIVFKSGDLSGYEFEIWKFDWDNKRLYFNPVQDSSGYVMPNETNKPQVGDKYTLVDINMPPIYVITAEANLKAAAQKYLDANCVPKLLYVVSIDPKYAKANAINIDAGDLVIIQDDYLGIDRAIRVNQISFPILNRYKMQAIIADFIPYTLQEQVAKSTISTSRNLQSIIKNTINNNTSNATVINNSSTTINQGSNVKKITINGQEFWWEKGFDNTGNDLEIGDVIYGNYWNRYIFVKKWTYLGGYKELRTSWDEIETIDETPET